MCEEGCGIHSASTCAKWRECYKLDMYADVRQQILETQVKDLKTILQKIVDKAPYSMSQSEKELMTQAKAVLTNIKS